MSKPLISDIFEQVRARLGDDQIGGGEVFIDSILYPHFAQAMRELFRVMRSDQDPYCTREQFYNLPVRTGTLDPATAGFFDIAEIEFVEWRPSALSYAITGVVVSGALATVTVVGHTFLDGNQIEISGVLGFDDFNSPNGSWTISVIDADTITLNGCTATGTYTSGGAASTGIGNFRRMTRRDFFDGNTYVAGATSDPDTLYVWQGGVFRFIPSGQVRELRFIYRSSGSFSSDFGAQVPIEDSQDYLAVRTAGLVAKAKGASETGNELQMEAVGPGGQPDGRGGLLYMLVANQVRNMQMVPYRRRAFRPRRNWPSPILY